MAESQPKLPPVPGETIHLRFKTLKAGSTLHRFHLKAFHATAFNNTHLGNARFSPIRDTAGAIIPTIYGGSTFDCAAMETIFRDVPYAPPPKYLSKSDLAGSTYSLLRVTQDLQLIDLSSKALRTLNIRRNELIDTERDQYPATRKWAEAFHAHAPHAQGITWISRQDDTAEVVVLFGDRVEASALSLTGLSRDAFDEEEVYNGLIDLADTIGVRFVP